MLQAKRNLLAIVSKYVLFYTTSSLLTEHINFQVYGQWVTQGGSKAACCTLSQPHTLLTPSATTCMTRLFGSRAWCSPQRSYSTPSLKSGGRLKRKHISSSRSHQFDIFVAQNNVRRYSSLLRNKLYQSQSTCLKVKE